MYCSAFQAIGHSGITTIKNAQTQTGPAPALVQSRLASSGARRPSTRVIIPFERFCGKAVIFTTT